MNQDTRSRLRTFWPFDTTVEQEEYIQQLLQHYRDTPTTAGHIRPADRQLARRLFQRGVPLTLVQAALSLAAVRRICRHPRAPRLNPVRSLHYFLPVLEELVADPPDPSYIDFINVKLRLHKRQTHTMDS